MSTKINVSTAPEQPGRVRRALDAVKTKLNARTAQSKENLYFSNVEKIANHAAEKLHDVASMLNNRRLIELSGSNVVANPQSRADKLAESINKHYYSVLDQEVLDSFYGRLPETILEDVMTVYSRIVRRCFNNTNAQNVEYTQEKLKENFRGFLANHLKQTKANGDVIRAEKAAIAAQRAETKQKEAGAAKAALQAKIDAYNASNTAKQGGPGGLFTTLLGTKDAEKHADHMQSRGRSVQTTAVEQERQKHQALADRLNAEAKAAQQRTAVPTSAPVPTVTAMSVASVSNDDQPTSVAGQTPVQSEEFVGKRKTIFLPGQPLQEEVTQAFVPAQNPFTAEDFPPPCVLDPQDQAISNLFACEYAEAEGRQTIEKLMQRVHTMNQLRQQMLNMYLKADQENQVVTNRFLGDLDAIQYPAIDQSALEATSAVDEKQQLVTTANKKTSFFDSARSMVPQGAGSEEPKTEGQKPVSRRGVMLLKQAAVFGTAAGVAGIIYYTLNHPEEAKKMAGKVAAHGRNFFQGVSTLDRKALAAGASHVLRHLSRFLPSNWVDRPLSNANLIQGAGPLLAGALVLSGK